MIDGQLVEKRNFLDLILSPVAKVAEESDVLQIRANARMTIATFGYRKEDLHEALTAIAHLRVARLISVSHSRLARLLTEVDKIDLAWKVIAESTDSHAMAESAFFIACARADSNDFERAKTSASWISFPSLRQEILEDISRAETDEKFRCEYLAQRSVFSDENSEVRIIRTLIAQQGYEYAFEAASKTQDPLRLINLLTIVAMEWSKSLVI